MVQLRIRTSIVHNVTARGSDMVNFHLGIVGEQQVSDEILYLPLICLFERNIIFPYIC